MQEVICLFVDYNYGFVKLGTGFIFLLLPVLLTLNMPEQLFFMIGVVSFKDKTNELIYLQFPIAYATILLMLNVYNVMHVGLLLGRKIKCLVLYDALTNSIVLVDKQYMPLIVKN